MGKYAALFLIVGLAVGLWLGLNPTTHRQLIRWWDQTTNRQASADQPELINLRRLDTQVNRWFRTSARPRVAAPPSQPTPVPSGPQITNEMQAFGDALHRIWLHFVAQLSKAST